MRSPWNPAYKDRAIRLFLVLAGLFVAVAVVGWLALSLLGFGREPLVLLLVVIGPLLTGAGMFGTAMVIRHHAVVGGLLKRLALPIFLGGVVGLVVAIWVIALLYQYVDGIEAAQSESARQVFTWFGGPLTVGEIQGYLTGGPATRGGWWGVPAGLWWPLQFH
ncbi:MAG: hypothetical protein WBL15_20405, partial [Phycisphaerae bacterium]